MSEQKKIIDMVTNGKISAVEAEKLLFALDNEKSNRKSKRKKFIIRVEKENAPKPKVNIAIPIAIAKLGMNFIPKNANIQANMESTNFDFSSIDWKEILEMVTSGEEGDLFYMDVEEDDGTTTTIRIFVE